MLAVLCDFKGREPQTVINHIFARLRALTADDPKRFREYVSMLEILSDNRDLKSYIKEAETMLTRVDVRKLPSYELGMEQGMEKGMEKGEKMGVGHGEKMARMQIARELLDVLSDEVIAEKTHLPVEAIRALRAESS